MREAAGMTGAVIGSAQDAHRLLEGVDRIPLLPHAEFIGVTLGGEPRDPVVVFIGWRPDLVERAYPGTAIWRAAVEHFLSVQQTARNHDPGLVEAAESSLRFFPTLDRWLAWVDRERPARAPAARPSRPAFWVGGW